jgi:hypothetical protein
VRTGLLPLLGALFVCLTIVGRSGSALGAQAVVGIGSVSPVAAHRGDTVTIAGRGFGGPNVRVTVGGVAARVLSATGATATFVVPATAPFGETTVRAINPGGQGGSIGFEVIPLLSQVTATASPDGGRRVSETIGRFGGSLETDGADGVHYRLDVPAGALSTDTLISIAPAGVSGLSALADNVDASVDFAPDGLQFAVPAYLTITFPGTLGKTFAATFRSGVPGVSFLLDNASEKTIIVPIEHFSDLAVMALRTSEIDQAIQDALAAAPQLVSPQLIHLSTAFHTTDSDADRNALAAFLLNLYSTTVQPAVDAADKSLDDFEVAYKLVTEFGGIVELSSFVQDGSDIYVTGGQPLNKTVDQGAADVSGKGETLFTMYSDSSDKSACTGTVEHLVDWLIIPLRVASVLSLLGNPPVFHPCLSPHVETLVPFPVTIDAGVQTLTATFQAGLAAPKGTPDGDPIPGSASGQQFFPEPTGFSLTVQGATFAGGGTSQNPISGPDGTITVQLDRGPDPTQRASKVTLTGTATIGDLGTVLVPEGATNVVTITQETNQSCAGQPSAPNLRAVVASFSQLDAQCQTVKVTPATASLVPGQQIIFGATVAGTSDQTVTWSATGGTIDQTGKYTAGSTPGTFSVTATSNADPTASDTAVVTIAAARTTIGLWRGSYTECSPGFACGSWNGTVTLVADLGQLFPNNGVSGPGAELECAPPLTGLAPARVFYETSPSASLTGQGPVVSGCLTDVQLGSGVVTGTFSGNLVFDLQTGQDNTPCDLTLTATRVEHSVSLNGPITITEQFSGVLLTNSLVEPCAT